MKTLMIVALVSLATTASAQAPGMDRNLNTRAARLEREKALVAQPEYSNKRIVGRRVTYSGIAVQAIKAENPVQLLNPAAPEKYGNGEDSVTRDPKSGRVNGLKLFSIEF
jgi:hypothetical protein